MMRTIPIRGGYKPAIEAEFALFHLEEMLEHTKALASIKLEEMPQIELRDTIDGMRDLARDLAELAKKLERENENTTRSLFTANPLPIDLNN